MRKLLKSRKALSPVVAAIILIAVTVAVSIAVAAWMGALTIGLTKTERLVITGLTWAPDRSYVTLNVTNSGDASVVINSAKMDENSKTLSNPGGSVTGSGPYTLNKGLTGWIRITTGGCTSGTRYTFSLISSNGHQYDYPSTAP